jgi:hypothetical protein
VRSFEPACSCRVKGMVSQREGAKKECPAPRARTGVFWRTIDCKAQAVAPLLCMWCCEKLAYCLQSMVPGVVSIYARAIVPSAILPITGITRKIGSVSTHDVIHACGVARVIFPPEPGAAQNQEPCAAVVTLYPKTLLEPPV